MTEQHERIVRRQLAKLKQMGLLREDWPETETKPCAHCGEAVGNRHAQIVVTMDAQGNGIDATDMFV